MTDEQATPEPPAPTPAAPRWQPLGARDRRVLGVLAEKAKTTPDTYPMSLNAIVSGCNQKSNRAPLMQLEAEDVQESLDRLRELGAVGMVEGYGRVTKYRHYLYEWLGVEKIELSIMTELLLRGAQTVGELRGRASRMDPIADLAALRTLLSSLKAKGLVIPLTAEGRGHVVAHALFKASEIEHLKAQFAAQAAAGAEPEDREPPRAGPSYGLPPAPAAPAAAVPRPLSPAAGFAESELAGLRAELRQLREQIDALAAEQEQQGEELRRLKDALGG
jgi:uncharacterized protein YceH (UPF0502 family)